MGLHTLRASDHLCICLPHTRGWPHCSALTAHRLLSSAGCCSVMNVKNRECNCAAPPATAAGFKPPWPGGLSFPPPELHGCPTGWSSLRFQRPPWMAKGAAWLVHEGSFRRPLQGRKCGVWSYRRALGSPVCKSQLRAWHKLSGSLSLFPHL